MATKSKAIITKAFLTILEDSPYEEITISEVCANTPLVRKTFYNNFSCKEDIVKYICEGLMTKYINNLTSSNQFALYYFANAFFEFGKKNKKIFNLLIRRKLFSIFKEEFISSQFFINSIIPNNKLNCLNKVDLNYVIAFHASGMLAIFEIWLASNFDKTTEEMSLMYTDIVKDIQEITL
ncbi:MAG: TetR/AcrR family transcriptional regulator [Acetobacterium sp.]